MAAVGAYSSWTGLVIISVTFEPLPYLRGDGADDNPVSIRECSQGALRRESRLMHRTDLVNTRRSATLSLNASSQAPAWEFGMGSSSFPSREVTDAWTDICHIHVGHAGGRITPGTAIPSGTGFATPSLTFLRCLS